MSEHKTREQEERFRKIKRERLFKAFIGLILSPVILILMVPINCFRDNEYPWDLF